MAGKRVYLDCSAFRHNRSLVASSLLNTTQLTRRSLLCPLQIFNTKQSQVFIRQAESPVLNSVISDCDCLQMEKKAMIVIATVLLLTFGTLADLPGGAEGPENNRLSRLLPVLKVKRYNTSPCSSLGQDCSSTRYCCHGLSCRYQIYIPPSGTCWYSPRNH